MHIFIYRLMESNERLKEITADINISIEIKKSHSNRFLYRSILIWPNERTTRWIQQSYSNYEEKSLHVLNHTLQRRV